jgi:hypothetical protein
MNRPLFPITLKVTRDDVVHRGIVVVQGRQTCSITGDGLGHTRFVLG